MNHAKNTPRWHRQLLLATLCAVLGFGGAVQARSNDTAGLSSLRQSDLVRILDEVGQRSARLQAEAEQLRSTRDQLNGGANQRSAALEEASRRQRNLAILAGAVSTTGPGVELQVSDPQRAVSSELLLDAVEELRNAGAEALQIGPVRVVAASYIVAASAGSVIVDGTTLSAPYTIKAIGDSRTLATALEIPGGVREAVERKGGSLTITERAAVIVDALRSDTPARYARPAS
jgi:uncharacterized protein YlxW (UPF0749 family)